MSSPAQVQNVDRARSHVVLLVLAVLSVPVAVVFPPGILFSLAVFVCSAWLMPPKGSRRRDHWTALALSGLGTAISLTAGLAMSAVGA